MSSLSTPFPDLPISGVTFPRSPIVLAAFAYTKEHTTEAVYNHCARAAYFALILATKLAPLAARRPNLETVVLACILHDMGWASTKELLSTYKRFEVDGADIARAFVEGYRAAGGERGEEWDERRVQTVWDSIARMWSLFGAFLSLALFLSPSLFFSLTLSLFVLLE